MKPKCDEPLSNLAFNFNVRRYIEVTEERDMYEGGFIARMYDMSTKKTVMRQTMFEAGRCRLTVSRPELKARLASEIKMR